MSPDEFAVEVSNLTIKFGDFTAVDKISFSVRKGEIFGFLGANGAGKTTTIRMLCGLLTPTSGTAQIAGLTFDDGGEKIKEKVGYMSQRFTLYNDLTVSENFEFTASLRKIPRDIFQKRIEELFSFVGFTQLPRTLVKDLPGGIKQELSLVAAMLHDPEIVFLDEPTAGVSPAARAPEDLKNQTFPEPLIEIEPKNGFSNWIQDIEQSPALTDLQPYGLRYHAV